MVVCFMSFIKKKWIWLGILVASILIIGGKIFMNVNEKNESLQVQKDVADYIAENYILYRFDKEEEDKIIKEFNRGKGNLKEKEYFEKLESIKEVFEINKIEFTGYSITPMNVVKLYFSINGIYKDDITLDSVSFETNKPIYTISTNSGDGPYYIDNKKNEFSGNITNLAIIYYEGKLE